MSYGYIPGCIRSIVSDGDPSEAHARLMCGDTTLLNKPRDIRDICKDIVVVLEEQGIEFVYCHKRGWIRVEREGYSTFYNKDPKGLRLRQIITDCLYGVRRKHEYTTKELETELQAFLWCSYDACCTQPD